MDSPAVSKLGNLQVERRDGYFSVTPKYEELRILQVTDMHVMPWTARETYASVRRICELFNADLVANTGDFFCSAPGFYIDWVCRRFDRDVGTRYPWTFAWGNHDCESFGDGDLRKAGRIEALLEGLPGCLYMRGEASREKRPAKGDGDVREKEASRVTTEEGRRRFDGFRGGNFALEIVNPVSGEPAVDLFILNSRRWHHAHPRALEWMESHSGRLGGTKSALPAICFYHVPNKEYQLGWGRGIARGINREGVSFEKDDGRIHTFLKSLGCVRGCFVGHDHVNDYWFDMDGVRYSYGRKTGMGSYGTSLGEPEPGRKAIRVGATLITIGMKGGSFAIEHETVFEDGTTWRP